MFITPAYAQGAAGAGAGGGLGFLVPMIGIFVIFYFLLIRPQQKRAKEHKLMVENLRKGDQVLTGGGLIGKVTKVRDGEEEVEVEIAENTRVRMYRSTIQAVMSKTEPAKQA